MCMTQKFWEALVRVLQRDDLAATPEFKTAAARHQHRDRLSELLDAEFARHPTGHWLSLLEGVLPVAPVLGLAQALQTDFFHESGMLATVPRSEEHTSELQSLMRISYAVFCLQ